VPLPAGMQDAVVTPIRHVIYIHGFASSPRSSKAERFERELRARDIGFSCPDLNQPAFESLTVTRMLDDVRRALDGVSEGPIALVGSSLGGFVAIHAAALHGRDVVDRIVLLAPAVDFGGNRLRQLGEHGIDEWRRTGSLEVFHYGDDTTRRIGYGLYEDASRYDAFAVVDVPPTLIYQGRRDDSVDPSAVIKWADGRPDVDLRLIDDDHQLTSSIDEIWDGADAFLLGRRAPRC
jgi:pimeloyl-ACP methyl ester carboxylesterase